MTRHELINPAELGAPKGYSHGVLAGPGRMLFVAGQIGGDEGQALDSRDFVGQLARALRNVVSVVRQAGGEPCDLVRLTIYVTDKSEYLRDLREVGRAYRTVIGRHFPAMALVEVSGLLEPGAKVEVEATAVIPERRDA